ncbi:FAD-dependent oxidoreductase [Alteromonas sp. ASW11-36]|uniref:FAD-dependent oxidoreductase n=1 Tax=Alteromonas arenosi TaxID=3055817 RepID=A0ABT7T0K7_9ALTE|nr:FAD-dependent oxidoreductase [Alteromonas sp. ASW11-36]MDM7861972.1 FAD-dependent oxidoreductase [Alteromonas sp. ASW11-36]
MDLIIGGGITGLSYANFTENDYLILEQDSELGGYCKTIKQDGFVWDYSGHFFHFKNRDIKDFVFERIEPQTILEVQKITHIYYNEQLIDFPFQKNIHQLEKSEFIDCLYDLFNRDSKPVDESFEAMLLSKFGKSICDKFLLPYNEKLYACPMNRLDKDAMGRFFPYADPEEIVKNFKENNTESYNNVFVYPEFGAMEYVKAIAKDVPEEKIRMNTRVVGIDMASKTVTLNTGETLEFDNLISTMPLNRLLPLALPEHDLTPYSSNKVAVFNLGFDSGSEHNSHWIYFPDKSISFYRIGFYDNIFGSDRMSLYVEIGMPTDKQDFSEEELLSTVLEDLRKAGVITSQKLVSHHFLIMDPAYVHISKDSEAAKAVAMKRLNENSIYSIGRYGAWTYCSIEDNIIEAKQLVESLRASS